MSGRRRDVNQTIKLRFEYRASSSCSFICLAQIAMLFEIVPRRVNLLDYPAFSTRDISIIVSLIPIKYRRHNANAITLNSIPTNPYSSSYS